MFSAVGSIRESLYSLDLFVRKTKRPLIMKLSSLWTSLIMKLSSLWTFFFRYIVLKGKLSVQFAEGVPKEIKTFINIVIHEYIVRYHSGGSKKLNACLLFLAHMVYL